MHEHSGVTEGMPGPMPPHRVIDDFLPIEDNRALLDWAIREEARFAPAKIFTGAGGHEQRIDPQVRVALKHYGIGPLQRRMTERLNARLQEIMAAAGYSGPEPRSLEFELNAYGDGAHFAPHIDVPVGAGRRTIGKEKGEDRVISAVYYFFREPRRFEGGALRLYRFGADPKHSSPDDSVAFAAEQNRVVIFPSWARHEVERVRCSSFDFADFRFALNCWFCRSLSD
jgi:predicted 2-oxoglutarate/Fe(II)-dependent dioxygenase YbiX